MMPLSCKRFSDAKDHKFGIKVVCPRCSHEAIFDPWPFYHYAMQIGLPDEFDAARRRFVCVLCLTRGPNMHALSGGSAGPPRAGPQPIGTQPDHIWQRMRMLIRDKASISEWK